MPETCKLITKIKKLYRLITYLQSLDIRHYLILESNAFLVKTVYYNQKRIAKMVYYNHF